MLTQSYFTSRMDYPSYPGPLYPSPLTIYPLTPPYSSAYDHQQALPYFGGGHKSHIDLSSGSSMYLDRPATHPLDLYLASVAHLESNRHQHHPFLPSPPLSVTSSSPPAISTYPTNAQIGGYHHVHQQINSIAACGSGCAGGSGCGGGGCGGGVTSCHPDTDDQLMLTDHRIGNNNYISTPYRKSVIMKIEDQRIMESVAAAAARNTDSAISSSSSSCGSSNIYNNKQSSDNEDEFICKWDLCYRVFATLEGLAGHVTQMHASNSHGGLYFCKWHSCPRSERGFNARYKMLVHIRTHTKEKPHQCSLCSKSFSRAENLKIHMRSHSGEKPYICSVEGCTKAYSNSSDRFKHTRTHAIEKPYFCKVNGCNKRYTDPSSLRKHVKTFKHNTDLIIDSVRNTLDDCTATTAASTTTTIIPLAVANINASNSCNATSQSLIQRDASPDQRHRLIDCESNSEYTPNYLPSSIDAKPMQFSSDATNRKCDCTHKCFKHYNHSDVVQLGQLLDDVNIMTPPKKSSFWREKYFGATTATTTTTTTTATCTDNHGTEMYSHHRHHHQHNHHHRHHNNSDVNQPLDLSVQKS